MERLEKAKQAEIKKMSDERIVSKLMKAGVSASELEALERAELLDRWAEVVLAGLDKPVEKPQEAAVAPIGYDIEFERQKFAFQVQQWQAEQEERKIRREIEERRWLAEDEFRREQIRLQQEQLAMAAKKNAADRDAEQSQVKMLKNFGDVLRNTVVKMGNDVLDFVPFCDSIERQFEELKVPDALRVSLLKPFLNERASLLVNRLDVAHQSDYAYVKTYLFDQFRLVPQYFLETFNSVRRDSRDTYKAFIAKLTMLLDYYLASRKVTNLNEFKELVVSDRVKSALPEGPLNHLLKVEASLTRKYATPDEMADILDTYYANYDFKDRPRASALGRPCSYAPPVKAVSQPVRVSTSQAQQTAAVAEVFTRHIKENQGLKTCFKCSSNQHLYKACPLRSTPSPVSTQQKTTNKVSKPTRANACTAERPITVGSHA